MRKFFKLLLRWIIISLVLQFAILIYLNNYMFSDKRQGKIKIVEETAAPEKDRTIKLPPDAPDNLNAETMKISYDGTLLAYISGDGGELTIFAPGDKRTVATLSEGDASESWFEWLPDRNILIYSLNDPDGGVKLHTYNADNEIKHDYPPISWLKYGSYVEDVALSPKTNVVYVKVRTEATNSAVFRYNIMDQVEFVMDVDPEMAIMSTTLEDKLVWVAPSTPDTLVIRDGVKYSKDKVPFKFGIALLGRDLQDNIYLAKSPDGKKTSSIIYSAIGDFSNKGITTVDLDGEVAIADIFMAADENIYILDRQTNSIIDPKTKKATKFDGEFIEVINGLVVSVESDKLKFTAKK